MKFYKEDDYIFTIIELIKHEKPKEKPTGDRDFLCPVNQLYTFGYLSTRFKITQFKNLN